ncbi:MAG: photosynthetic reaction center cytochrome c subunit [Myxococcales bacterium]|nr:photosynthetic reaction center cytochrome c subunit [Myxococcales bacterium]
MNALIFKILGIVTFVVLGIWYYLQGPDIAVSQQGFQGTGMAVVVDTRDDPAAAVANRIPDPLPPADAEGARSATVAYENVQVLRNLNEAEFTRMMAAVTAWVAPQQGCNYCHVPGNLASDDIYTKVVSRRMFQMTQYINANWTSHVQQTGVTCYTCHRGQPVPQNIWFEEPLNAYSDRLVGNPGGQNRAAPSVGLASLPSDPFSPYLASSANIRIQSLEPLPTDNGASIKRTEWTYGLMMHMSTSLGVNCTYCHNSRSWGSWEQSPPARAVAYYGIRLVRDVNQNYLVPLQDEYPPHRLGPLGDAPKANCATCHQGVYKPLLGQSMLDDYPVLRAPYVEEQAPDGEGAVPPEAAPSGMDEIEEEPTLREEPADDDGQPT